MLGRTANGIFWMSRYIERAENMARLIDAETVKWGGVVKEAGIRAD